MTRRRFAGALGAGVVSASAASKAPEFPPYPLYTAKGSHRELGRQHGEQASRQIHKHLEVIASSFKGDRAEVRRRAARFQPLFDGYCPHLVEEIRGLAEGARISFEDALAVNIRGELGRAQAEGCTAYAIGPKATGGRGVIAGQNADVAASTMDYAYVLHLQPVNKPQALFWSFGGMIGYHGMNSAGVGEFANALGGGPAGKFAMPHYPVKRLMLECRSLDEVLKVLERVPLASNGNYVLCDGSGKVLDVEATSDGPNVIRDEGAGYLAHSNHFLCPRYATKENYKQGWGDSFNRLDRMNAMIRERYGKVTVEDVKKFLRDHSGDPAAICRHGAKDSVTAASLIAETANRCLHVATGNPCANRHVTHTMA